MALSATLVWEVRTTGQAGNGGGWNTAGTGTDRSQADTPFCNGTNLTVHSVTNTDVVPDGYTPVAADVGNVIQIQAATGFTAGFYQIASVQSSPARWRLDRTPAAINTAGATWALGGAIDTPLRLTAAVSGAPVMGNFIFAKSGTYPITATCALPSGVRLVGYSTNRVGNCVDDPRPILQASGISSAAILTVNGHSGLASNVILDGANLSAVAGLAIAGGKVTRVWAINCADVGFKTGATAAGYLIGCEASACGYGFYAFNTGYLQCLYCYAHNNGGTGFMGGPSGLSAFAALVGCISANNAGATSDGFMMATYLAGSVIGCIAYGNGRHGFNAYGSGVALSPQISCIAQNNGGYGFYTSGGSQEAPHLHDCYAGLNTTGPSSGYTNLLLPLTAYTANAFADPGSGDFSPNTDVNGGALMRSAAKFPNFTLTPGLVRGYRDVGAIQHQDTGGSGGMSRGRFVMG